MKKFMFFVASSILAWVLALCIVLLMLSIAGCAAISPERQRAISCNAASNALIVLSTKRAAGELDPETVAGINAAIPAFKSVCINGKPLDETAKKQIDLFEDMLVENERM